MKMFIRTRSIRGFTLVELMVALALAGFILLGLSAYFVSSSRSFSETERVSRQIENGRYASSLLAEEIRHAGFYGEVGNVMSLPPTSAIALPGAMPDPCEPAIASVRAALPIAVQGVDSPDALTTKCQAALANYLSGTDVIVIRRASTIPVGPASAGPAAGDGYYTQVAYCETADPMFKVAQTAFNLKAKDCTTDNPVRQLHVYVYYIASCSINCGVGAPSIPTLKRAELSAGGTFTVTPLVEGIENMQFEYGIDTNGDGNPDVYKALPASVTEWSQVVTVSVNLLARNIDKTPGYVDNKTYYLGKDRLGADNIPAATNDSYRRHNYRELVRVQNPSQRSEASFAS